MDGSPISSVTLVHADRIPMTPGAGMQLCEGDRREVEALGLPPRDTAWTLDVFDRGVATLIPTAEAVCSGDNAVGLCPDSASCGGTVIGFQPGITTILAQLKCCPSGHTSDPDLREVAVVKPDLRIQGLPEEDNPAPNEAHPGALIPYLDPDVASPDDYQPVPMEIGLEPAGMSEGRLTLSATRGGDSIRVWEDAGRTRLVPLPRTWSLATEMPPSEVYVEGVLLTELAGAEVKLDYEGCADTVALTVFGVAIKESDPCEDRIQTVLVPSGLEASGELSIRLLGPGGNPIKEILPPEQRSPGSHTDVFQLDELARFQEWTTLETKWTLGGFSSVSQADVHFKSFGMMRHTVYNTPWESDPSCAGAAINVCLRDPDPSQCNWTVEQVSRAFASQVASRGHGTGSGESANFGLLQQEAFCVTRRPPPASFACVFLFERNATHGNFCGNDILNDGTVAVHSDLRREGAACGREICIRRDAHGIRKTVTDQCPACGINKIDNYSTRRECNLTDPEVDELTLLLYE